MLRHVLILGDEETGTARRATARIAPGDQTLVSRALGIVRGESHRGSPIDRLRSTAALRREGRADEADPRGAAPHLRRHDQRRVSNPKFYGETFVARKMALARGGLPMKPDFCRVDLTRVGVVGTGQGAGQVDVGTEPPDVVGIVSAPIA